jgi:hypothetical protein
MSLVQIGNSTHPRVLLAAVRDRVLPKIPAFPTHLQRLIETHSIGGRGAFALPRPIERYDYTAGHVHGQPHTTRMYTSMQVAFRGATWAKKEDGPSRPLQDENELYARKSRNSMQTA